MNAFQRVNGPFPAPKHRTTVFSSHLKGDYCYLFRSNHILVSRADKRFLLYNSLFSPSNTIPSAMVTIVICVTQKRSHAYKITKMHWHRHVTFFMVSLAY